MSCHASSQQNQDLENNTSETPGSQGLYFSFSYFLKFLFKNLFLICLFLTGGKLQYGIGFCIHQHESAIGIHMSSPSWTFLPPPTTLCCHRALSLSSLSYSKFPLAVYFIYGNVCVSMLLFQFITPSPSPNLSTEIDFYNHPIWSCGFPDGSMVKNPSANTGNVGLIPGLGRSLGEGNGNPLQYSCWGNLMDRGAWQAAVHGVTEELDTTQWLNNNNLEQQSEHCAKWKRSLNLKTCESRSLWCILGWSLGNASANLLNESGKCPD